MNESRSCEHCLTQGFCYYDFSHEASRNECINSNYKDWQPDYKTLKSQLSVITAERDRALGERDIFKNQFIKLIEGLEKELDKDGWCRLVITQEKLQEFKSFLLEFSNSKSSEV